MRPGLGERLVDVRGREQASHHGQLGSHGTAVVARAVQPLVVQPGQGADLRQGLGPGQDALRVVRVQTHPLPLALRQRPALAPDTGRDADPPQVVEQAGPP